MENSVNLPQGTQGREGVGQRMLVTTGRALPCAKQRHKALGKRRPSIALLVITYFLLQLITLLLLAQRPCWRHCQAKGLHVADVFTMVLLVF